ncbi:MAG: hypothetical protein ACFFFK_04155 [Candidatus Thorarchaeota archaeon]
MFETRESLFAVGGFLILLSLWGIGTSIMGNVFDFGLLSVTIGTCGFYVLGYALRNND